MKEFEENGFFTMDDGQLSHLVVPQNPKFLDSIFQPKKPKSSYNIFLQQKLKGMGLTSPDVKFKDKFKVTAEAFSKLDEKEKQNYDLLAQQDKERYFREVNDLITLGYFIMPDGSKSSDHIKKPKIKRTAITEEEKQEEPNDDKHKTSVKSLKRKGLDLEKDVSTPKPPSKKKATEKNKSDTPMQTSKSPRTKSPNPKSPTAKSPNSKSPNAESPSAKSPVTKSPKKKIIQDEKPMSQKSRSRSRSKSPQKKAADKTIEVPPTFNSTSPKMAKSKPKSSPKK